MYEHWDLNQSIIKYSVVWRRIETVLAVSSSKLFLNWTVEDWNQPITGYSLSYREEGDNSWHYHQVRIHFFKISI
jgi:hypothetical protein